jgi:hypothetical protein
MHAVVSGAFNDSRLFPEHPPFSRPPTGLAPIYQRGRDNYNNLGVGHCHHQPKTPRSQAYYGMHSSPLPAVHQLVR